MKPKFKIGQKVKGIQKIELEIVAIYKDATVFIQDETKQADMSVAMTNLLLNTPKNKDYKLSQLLLKPIYLCLDKDSQELFIGFEDVLSLS